LVTVFKQLSITTVKMITFEYKIKHFNALIDDVNIYKVGQL